MAASNQQPPAAAAQDDPATAWGPNDRTAQALARSRELRARSRQLIAKRHRIAPATAAASRTRDQVDTGNGRQPGGEQQGPTTDLYDQVEYAKVTRKRLAALAADLADTEDNVAHVHDEMAGRDPENAAIHRLAADEARQAAHRAREFQSTVTDGTTGTSSS